MSGLYINAEYNTNNVYNSVEMNDKNKKLLISDTEQWIKGLDGIDSIKNIKLVIDLEGQNYPLIIFNAFIDEELIHAYFGFKQAINRKTGVNLDYIMYHDRQEREITLQGTDMHNFVEKICKSYGIIPKLKDKNKYINEAKKYYINQLNKITEIIGKDFALIDKNNIEAYYHDFEDAPDEIIMNTKFKFKDNLYTVQSIYYDGTREFKKGIGYYHVYLDSNTDLNTDLNITNISQFKNELNKLDNKVKEYFKDKYKNDSQIKKTNSLEDMKTKHDEWIKSQSDVKGNTKSFIGTKEDLINKGINLNIENLEQVIVIGDFIKESDLGHCIYTIYILNNETGTYLRKVYIVDDYGTSEEINYDDIEKVWSKIKKDIDSKQWIYTEEKKQIVGRQINSYIRKLPNSNMKAEVEFDSIKQKDGEINAILSYNVKLNKFGKNKLIIKIDTKLDDNRKITALRLKAIDNDGNEIVVNPENCWNVVNTLLDNSNTDGFVEFKDEAKVKSYRGIINENNKASSIKKIERMSKYLNVIKLPNYLYTSEEFGKVLYIGFNDSNLKFYISSGVIYDTYNLKVIVKKDEVNGIKDMLEQFFEYVNKQDNVKNNKNVQLGLKIFLLLYLNAFDLRRPELDSDFIINEFNNIKRKRN